MSTARSVPHHSTPHAAAAAVLLPCCVSFRFVSCQCVPSPCSAVILSTGQIFAQRCCRPCRWIAPAIAHFSPRLAATLARCLYRNIYIVIVHVFAWLCLAAVARVVFCKSFRRVVGMSEMLKYLHSRTGKRLTPKREVAPLPGQATPSCSLPLSPPTLHMQLR